MVRARVFVVRVRVRVLRVKVRVNAGVIVPRMKYFKSFERYRCKGWGLGFGIWVRVHLRVGLWDVGCGVLGVGCWVLGEIPGLIISEKSSFTATTVLRK